MKRTLVIKDSEEFTFRKELDSVLNDYNHRVFNINTGVIHEGYDSQGCRRLHYYAIVIVEE